MRRATDLHGRDDHGATAVLVAVLALVLLGVGAFAVDMGQVYAKRSALQSNVDLAVLAAAAKLDGPGPCSTEVVEEAEEYLLKDANEVPGQIAVDLQDPDTVSNGHIVCNDWKVKLWAPNADVDFGLAKALDDGNEGVEVPAYAEAGVYSPGTGSFPAYSTPACSYGPQTVFQPPNSPTSAGPLGLKESSTPYHTAEMAGHSQDAIHDTLDPGINDGESVGLTIFGRNNTSFSGTITHVAFSQAEDGPHEEVLINGTTVRKDTTKNPDEIVLDQIPASVATVEGVWWIRLSADGIRWTDPDKALYLTVGDPPLECDAGSDDGNFGGIDLRRPPLNENASIVENLKTSPPYGLTTLNTTSLTCSPGSGGAVAPPGEGTNCVPTTTGFTGQLAADGLITDADARLNVDTTDGCDPSGGSDRRQAVLGSQTYEINDDVLTCFFTSGVSINEISDASYAGPSVISKDIFSSPRFFWIPMFKGPVDPGNSGQNYSIIDFRPIFLTGELGSSRPGSVQMDTSMENGMRFAPNQITHIKVVFFDVDALPESITWDGPVMDYLGVGTKVIRLID